MKPEIRPARKEDIDALCRICSEEMGYPCAPELVEAKWMGLDPRREAVFVAVLGDNGPVGYIHVERYDVLYFETMANILGLAVRSDFQRNGIGKALISQAEAWAKEHGIHLMRLNSGISRTGAHEFYRRQGYVQEKEQLRFMKEI